MKNKYVILAYLSLFCLGFVDNFRSAIYPNILRDYNINTVEGSYFFFVPALTGLITNLAARWFLPQIGIIISHRIFMVFQFFGCLGIGWSMTLESDYYLLITSAGILGIGLAGSGMTQNILMTMGTTKENRQRLISGFHTMYGIASLLAPIFFALMLKLGFSWQDDIKFIGLLPLLIVIFSCNQSGKRQFVEKRDFSNRRWLRYYLGFIFALYVASEMAISTRLTLFMQRHLLSSESLSAYYLSGFFACLLLGRLGFSFVKVDVNSKRALIGASLSTVILNFVGLYLHPLGLVLCGLTMAIYFPVAMVYLIDVFGKEVDMAIATTMAFAGICVMTIHWAIGQLTESVGIRNALLLGPTFLLFSLLLFVFRKRCFANEKVL